LADTVKASPALQPFKTAADAIKAYVDVQPLIGADKVPIPKDWSNPDQVKAFNAKLGVPEKPEAYELGKVLTEKFKDVPLDKNRLAGFEKRALEAGLTPRQAKLLAESQVSEEVQRVESYKAQQTQQRQQALEDYKKTVGNKFDEKVAFGRKALANLSNAKDLVAILESTGLGDHPAFIEAFSSIGQMFREDTAHATGATGSLQDNSSDSARVRIAELKKDPNFIKALGEAGNPAHKASVEEWTRLHGMLSKNK
jgi:hypothetical protein